MSTLKHIDFYDSPVMRELERQAVKNGTFEVATIVDIVKTASQTKPVAPKPSKDLYRDMINLAVALRKKGLEKEATSLENKIFLHKQAETHLYRAIDEDAEDVLNFAHPDGDHHVADAQDHNGDVETLESKHHKMVQVVNKNPTGKYAQLVDNLLLATAEVLDVDLKKIAQVPKGKAKGKLTPEDQEDLAQEQFELEAPEETKKKVGEANASLKSGLDKFIQDIQAAAAATGVSDAGVAEWVAFNPLKVMQGQQNADYYAKKAGVSKEAIQSYWAIHNAIYNQNPMTPDSVARIIWNTNDYWKVKNIFSKAVPDKASYFEGSKVTDVWDSEKAQIEQNIARGDSRWKNNPSSIWISNANWGATDFDWIKLDPAAVTAAANDINQTLVAKYNQLFGQDKLTKAAEGVKADLSEFMNSLKYLQQSAGEVPAVRKTVGLAVGQIQSIIKNIDIAAKQLKVAGAAYTALGATAVPGTINGYLETGRNGLNELITSLQQLKLEPTLDNPIPPELLNSISAKFKRVAITLRNYLANDTEKTQEEIDAVKDNFNSARNIYSLLSNSKSTPFAYIRSQIANNFPEATSPQALDKIANEGLELAKQYETAPEAQKADDGLTVEAQWKQPGKPAAKPGAGAPKPGTAKPGTKPGARPQAQSPDMKRLDTTKSDRVAVATMQLALNNFGRGISIPENKAKFPKVTDYKPEDGLTIIGTGPKSNPHINMFDGVWGPSTETAVELANKYLTSLGLTLRTGQRWDYTTHGHKPDTEEAAKFNAGAINRANAMMGVLSGASGAGPSSATAVYDKLPPIVSQDTVLSTEALGATIPITGKDLSSLGSLFNFLEQHNISVKPPVPMERTSDEIGLTFNEWNYLLYWLRGRSRTQYEQGSDKALKREYFNAVSTLAMRLAGVAQQLGIKGTENQNIVVPTTMLTSGESVNRGQGQGGQGESSRFNLVEDRSGRGRRGGQGGGDLEGTRTRMTSGPSDDTAPPISDVIDLRREWFNLPYQDMEISPVLRLEDFQRVPGARMAQGLFGGNTVAYQQFLNMLWQQIKSAFAAWSNDASTDEVTAIQNYYNRWQQGLAKQYRDITQGRRTY